MARPPIQLLNYVVERLLYEVNPAYRYHDDRTPPDASALSLNLEVHWESPEPFENAQDEPTPDPDDLDPKASSAGPEAESDAPDMEILPVDLVIQINADEDPDARLFHLDLRLSGLFLRISEADMKARGGGDDYLMHTLATGISMLYGAARQIVASTTSQSPYDKTLLPPISPLQIAQRVLRTPSESDSSPAADD